MDEEIQLISENTKKEKLKNFFLNNKKKIASAIVGLLITVFAIFLYTDFDKRKSLERAYNFNQIIAKFINKEITLKEAEQFLIKIIEQNDRTYSPLALNFIIDNEIILDKNRINNLYDIVLNNSKIEKEIKNLIIYKKALFNSDYIDENNLINILNPIINSESIWSSHALYLLGEYFYSRNERQKSKEFFNKIINLESSNPSIKTKAQNKLNRYLSD
tara:strand:- start:1918 stop:2568 length:651 start_codon:yes stop_codon:yes gene_type:complete